MKLFLSSFFTHMLKNICLSSVIRYFYCLACTLINNSPISVFWSAKGLWRLNMMYALKKNEKPSYKETMVIFFGPPGSKLAELKQTRKLGTKITMKETVQIIHIRSTLSCFIVFSTCIVPDIRELEIHQLLMNPLNFH